MSVVRKLNEDNPNSKIVLKSNQDADKSKRYMRVLDEETFISVTVKIF